MAKLQRKDVKIFASNPNHQTQVTTFLTAVDPTPDYSSDPNAIQNEYYPKGWLAKGNDDLPQGEDLNGVLFAESYKNAYLYQMGIAEWNATDEYCENSFCQVNGVLYKSLINSNTNNNPTTDDGTKWEEIPLEPYTGENIGTAEGVYAGKTLNNELQFKTIAVTGNGNITSSGDTITIAIGGGGTGDVYWGAIDGTLSNQSDLQQALNLKQNLIGYTPENTANKVTTIRTDDVATNTAYPTELATRTAIESAIESANEYTDNALLNLSSDVFILYAETWTDANTGTLTTTKPTGIGNRIPITVGTTPTTIGTFTYTTTNKTIIDPSFFYDIYIQINRSSLSSTTNCDVNVTLTIQHPDVLGGTPITLVNNDVSYAYPIITTTEVRTPIQTQTKLEFPIGSTIKLLLTASATASGEITLIVYDEDTPIIISRNQYLKDISATCIFTQNTASIETQEELNNYMLSELGKCLRSFSASAPLSLSNNTLSISKANGSTNGYLASTDWTTFNNKYNSANTGINMFHTTDTTTIRPVVEAGYENSYIGTSSYPFTNGYITNLSAFNLDIKNSIVPADVAQGSFFSVNIGTSTKRMNKIYATSIDVSDNVVSASQPLSIYNNTLSIRQANSSQSGYLSSSDWTTFNNKVSSTSDCAKLTANNTLTGTNKLGNVTIQAGNISRDDGAIYLSASGELRLISDTQVRIRCSATGAGTSGNFRYYGKITAGKASDENPISTYPSSDIRLKKDIKETTINGIETINKINIKEFRYKTEDEKHYKHIGVIAQEIEEYTPEIKDVVLHGEDDEKDMLAVEYGMFTPYLIKAVQELSAKVEKLEARIEELEKNKKELKK